MIVQGAGIILLNNDQRRVAVGDVASIAIGDIHRIENDGTECLVIIEIQLGVCTEDDIIRLEDDWHRK